jgi:hypothetical protein
MHHSVGDIGGYAQVGKERWMLGDHADEALGGWRDGGRPLVSFGIYDASTIDRYASVVGFFQSGDEAEQGAFACA